jgi:endonuclease/exonuclease/phosphatase family metal-dependent hydrolase
MPNPLRLVSFNILEGFRSSWAGASERRLIDRDRAKIAQTVVVGLDPDILVLNEALFCRTFAGKTVDYASLFDYPYHTAALYDDAWGNAILSRHPIANSCEMRIYNRGGLTALLITPQGPLTVASYHPHPRREPANKALDFSRLVAGLTGPLIVCGDFNCISPEDQVDRGQLVGAFQSFSTDATKVVDQFIESGKLVFSALAEFGLRDAIPPDGRRYSIPTDLINTNKSSAIRIDHILANSAIEVVAGEVVHSSNTNRASDHHPVMVEFRIRPA